MLRVMQEYAEWVWSIRMESGLFSFGGKPPQVEEQGAVVQLFALLAWQEERYAALA